MVGLFVLALNAKEMAAALPAVLICYELFYHCRLVKSKPFITGLSFRQLTPALVCVALTLVAAQSKTGEGSVMHGNPPYRITISASQFLGHWRQLMSDLVYARRSGLTIPQMLGIWLVLIAIAAAMETVTRKGYAAFFLAFALLAPLPVIFIPYRGFFVMYLPLAGWTLFLAAVLVDGRNYIRARVWNRLPLSANPFEPERLFLFVAVAGLLVWIPRHDLKSERVNRDRGQAVITAMRNDIVELDEPLPKGARILFLHDRFPADAWGTLMICRLLYRDLDLWADRPTMMSQPPDPAAYDRVFDYVNGKLAVVGRRAQSGPTPQQLNYPD